MSYSIKQDPRGVYYQLETPVIARGPGGQFVSYNINMMNAAMMAYNDLLNRLRDRAEKTFQRGQASWPDLDPNYKAWKVRQGMSSQKLIATGQLKDSLTKKTNLSITEIGKWRAGFKVKFGTKRPYAHTHQFGRGVPKRRFLTLIGARGDAPFFISRYNHYMNMMSPTLSPNRMGGAGGGAYSAYGALLDPSSILAGLMMGLGLISELMESI
jgi:phage gpG-like protein